MRMKSLVVSLICLLCSCSSEEPSSTSPYPTGSVAITDPTYGEFYTTLEDVITLYGVRTSSISAVAWENLSTGATGTGSVWDYTHWCFFFGYYECTDYNWGASVPLQLGENRIRIYGNGSWADSIIVTRTASFKISGTVSFGGSGQLNIKLTLVDLINPSALSTAFTDTSGSYSFNLVTAGTYSLTPSDECYEFQPSSRQVPVLNADVLYSDFAVIEKLNATVSGRLTWVIGGAGVYGASLKLINTTTAAERTVTSNPAGYYTFTCVPDGSYRVEPLSVFYGNTVFPDPASRTLAVAGGIDVSGLDFDVSY